MFGFFFNNKCTHMHPITGMKYRYNKVQKRYEFLTKYYIAYHGKWQASGMLRGFIPLTKNNH